MIDKERNKKSPYRNISPWTEAVYIENLRKMGGEKRLNIPYMITGGIAVIFFGKPRLTHDFDYLKEWAKKLRVVMLLDALLKKKLRG